MEIAIDAAAVDDLRMQRLVSRITGPLWIGGAITGMRLLGYRIDNHAEVRAEYRDIRRRYPGPLLICANHLTMIDSPILAWALASGPWYVTHTEQVPWNVPEQTNFGRPWHRALAVYLMRCILVARGGERDGVARVLERVAGCLRRNEPVLIFPEGGRSRSGRVEVEAAQYGIGRVLQMVEGCPVLCVYMRGEGQETWGGLPRRGERFHVALSTFTPRSERRGLRRRRDLARQVVERLAAMEEAHFDGRQ